MINTNLNMQELYKKVVRAYKKEIDTIYQLNKDKFNENLFDLIYNNKNPEYMVTVAMKFITQMLRYCYNENISFILPHFMNLHKFISLVWSGMKYSFTVNFMQENKRIIYIISDNNGNEKKKVIRRCWKDNPRIPNKFFREISDKL